MTSKAVVFGIPVGLILAVCVGCATVDPRPDYERTREHVRASTGTSAVFEPEREESVADEVASMLDDGLTAEEAVAVCLLHNPRLQAAFYDVGMARADVVQSGLLTNPFVGISARFPDGGGLAAVEASTAQNIAELWQIPVRKRAAKHELDQAVLNLARQATELAADCKTAYYDAVAAGQRLSIATENLDLADNLLEMAQTRQQAGAGTELDVNLSRGAALDAALKLEAARLAEADARRKLATLLGLDADAAALTLSDPLPEIPLQAMDAAALVSAARQSRLDVRAARQAVTAAVWRLEEQHRLVFPTIEIGLELEREARRGGNDRDILADTARASVASGSLTAPSIQPRSEQGSAGQDITIGPTLGLVLPIFDQNQAQIARARFAYRRAIRLLDAFERDVAQEVHGAVDEAVTAWRVAGMYRERSLPLAERNLELSRQAYEAGQTSFLSVLEAQRFFLESRRGYVEAARRAATAIPALERTIGLPFRQLISASPTQAHPPKPQHSGEDH